MLAQDVFADIDIPPAANSAMDGYTMRFEDFQEGKIFEVSQRIPAGLAPLTLKENVFLPEQKFLKMQTSLLCRKMQL